MKTVVDVSDEELEMYEWLSKEGISSIAIRKILNGIPLPKGHGRLIDADSMKTMKNIQSANFNAVELIRFWVDSQPTIIEADKEYDVKAITRGNCMACGKELTEGVFFCKECEEKGRK